MFNDAERNVVANSLSQSAVVVFYLGLNILQEPVFTVQKLHDVNDLIYIIAMLITIIYIYYITCFNRIYVLALSPLEW